MAAKNQTKTNLFLDIAIAIALVLAMTPRTTGIAVHEWLSIAFMLAIVIHVVLHWDWITGVAPRLFKNRGGESKVNFVIDALFFIAIVISMLSGLLISKSALPALGITIPFSLVWKQAHTIATYAAVIALGIHFGMHAPWLKNAIKRYIAEPVGKVLGVRNRAPADDADRTVNDKSSAIHTEIEGVK